MKHYNNQVEILIGYSCRTFTRNVEMDPLDAFFKGIPIQRKTFSSGSTEGRLATEYETPSYKEDKVPEKTTKYAQPFVKSIRREVGQVS